MNTLLNVHAIRAIYRFEMARTFRTLGESIASPVLTTSLYFVVFGAAIGGRMGEVGGVSYGAFIIPGLVMTPLTFLGGAFYSIDMLPPVWQKVTLFNPVLYLISGFRWSFYGQSDVPVGISLAAISAFLALCLLAVWWVFKTGWKLKT